MTIETTSMEIIKEVGFPIFVAGVLLWDKVRNNNNMKKVVENNNNILNRIERRLSKE